MELKTKFDMMSQKTFELGHPDHLFTYHLLHIEIIVVFRLKERRRWNHSEAKWCCVMLCFAVVMHILENDENGVLVELRVVVFDLEKKPKLEWRYGIQFWEKKNRYG